MEAEIYRTDETNLRILRGEQATDASDEKDIAIYALKQQVNYLQRRLRESNDRELKARHIADCNRNSAFKAIAYKYDQRKIKKHKQVLRDRLIGGIIIGATVAAICISLAFTLLSFTLWA